MGANLQKPGSTSLAEWLRGGGREIEDERRAWVQPSLTAGLFLAVLEEGPHGHGRSTFYGKAETPDGALRVAVEAWAGRRGLRAGEMSPNEWPQTGHHPVWTDGGLWTGDACE